MDVREKLVDDVHSKLMGLLQRAPYIRCEDVHRQYAVNWLMNNGVTVQEWISFDEVKPKDGQSVLGITTEGEMEVYQFDANWKNCLCQYGGNVKVFNITHWCELPQPPKGE